MRFEVDLGKNDNGVWVASVLDPTYSSFAYSSHCKGAKTDFDDVVYWLVEHKIKHTALRISGVVHLYSQNDALVFKLAWG